ncbi:hypothetical protein [Bacillus cereus]|uniref:hypothetical protein n=1 Tax=Bacillus cereus TaxID=1396 RepID=UPI000BF32833|nr:hypothetical protein [Bacillus cereus]PEQ94761.1 hypothetical protein CN477_30385 [Bacillus cereus]
MSNPFEKTIENMLKQNRKWNTPCITNVPFVKDGEYYRLELNTQKIYLVRKSGSRALGEIEVTHIEKINELMQYVSENIPFEENVLIVDPKDKILGMQGMNNNE